MLPTIAREADVVVMIDQRKLPSEEIYVRCKTAAEVARAIKAMVIRGAPAIGVAAAMGIALGVRRSAATGTQKLAADFYKICEMMAATRPTAVNLFWAIDRMMAVAEATDGNTVDIKDAMLTEALSMLDEDIAANRRLGRYGAERLPDVCSVLTHCNAGALATVAYGTALGVIRAAVEAGKSVSVYADETRPRLQGMKLTAWELAQDGIPVTIIADNMAAALMRQGKVDCVIVGADRIAANGDTANKIGTYGLAIAARHHRIPFYVAAPFSTIDLKLATGAQIPIEQRDSIEMTHIDGVRISPEGVPVLNPAFDVTPGDLVTAFITERGVLEPPFEEALAQFSPEKPERLTVVAPQREPALAAS
jgi:methylthioribose-1-phosphate isomerase